MVLFFYLKNKMSSEISNTAKRNEADRHRQKNLFQTMLARPEIGPLGVMLLLFGMLGYFSIPEGQFSLNPFTGEGFNALGIRNNFRVIAQLGIVALGAGMLIISGEFDLSVGSMIGFAGGCMAMILKWGFAVIIPYPSFADGFTIEGFRLFEIQNVSPLTAILITLCLTLSFGWFQGWFIVKSGISSFIVTLGGLFFLRGLTEVSYRAFNKKEDQTAGSTTVTDLPDIKNIIDVPGHGEMERDAAKALPNDQLLEVLMLEAELLELKAVSEKMARGTIIEAKLDKGRGPVATVLVQEGTLREGDPFITGIYSSRVRALLNEHGGRVEVAGPSTPVQVLGFPGVPQAGDTFAVTNSEREAKDLSQRRQLIKREQDHRKLRSVTLSDLHDQIQQGNVQELRVIVKGDVDGSVEAISQELGGITHEEVRVNVIHNGVGAISESDVLLASASNAIILGFHVQIDPSAREVAQQEGVEVRSYKVIYEVVEEVRAALSGLLAPSYEEQVVGSAEVRQVFSSSRAGTIAGCMVQNGQIARNNQVRVVRSGEAVFTGSIASLRRFKDDVREVSDGYECGIGIEGFNDIEEGDIIEALVMVETVRTL